MLQNLPLTVLTTIVISMTTIASVAALDGDDPTETPVESPSPEASATPEPEETEAPEDTDGDDAAEETEAAESEDGEGEGADKVAQAIADACDMDVAEVLAAHDEGIGFGAIYKLRQLSIATGIAFEDMLTDHEEDGGGWAFGKMFKELTDEQKTSIEDLPKNLGQAVSGDDEGTETAGSERHGRGH